jgi:hypothetical protein
VETVTDCVVAPFDQRFPLAAEEVSTTLSPSQNVVGPPADIVGVAGIGLTVTTVAAEGDDVQAPSVVVTVYDPGVVTVMEGVVAPFDQVYPNVDDDVRVTEPPSQNVVGPLAEIVGVAGVGLTVTACAADEPEEHPLAMTSTE